MQQSAFESYDSIMKLTNAQIASTSKFATETGVVCPVYFEINVTIQSRDRFWAIPFGKTRGTLVGTS